MKLLPILMMMMSAANISVAEDDAGLTSKESHFLMELISSGDPDLEYEIVDMDDAIEKAKMLRAMAKMVSETEANGLATHPKKRFLNEIKNAIIAGAKKIEKFVKKILHEAESFFEKKVNGKYEIDFHEAVNKLKKCIDSKMTVSACSSVLTTVAGFVLGTAAVLAEPLAIPLCNQALAELQHLALEH